MWGTTIRNACTLRIASIGVGIEDIRRYTKVYEEYTEGLLLDKDIRKEPLAIVGRGSLSARVAIRF